MLFDRDGVPGVDAAASPRPVLPYLPQDLTECQGAAAHILSFSASWTNGGRNASRVHPSLTGRPEWCIMSDKIDSKNAFCILSIPGVMVW